jgi:hypothetical protein
MGAFDDVLPVTMPRSEEERQKWGWEPHEQVVVKGSMTVADQEYVTNNYSKAATGKKNSVEVQMGTGRFSLLDRMILSWTFKYKGQDVPLSRHTIRQLPAHYSNRILEICDEIAQPMSEEEQEDFLDGANGPTVESSGMTSRLRLTS